jgi:glucose-1-phosphate thymidylyltransferase
MHREFIGLVPAGGRAARLAPLPCSKELYPVGFRQVDGEGVFRCKVVCHHLLESLRVAGITKAFIILREGKWDIPAYLGDGKIVDMNLAYLMMDLPLGVPFTLDQAYPFLQDACVALGFPDILFYPVDAFARLIEKLEESDADLILGLFPASSPMKMDMVEEDHDGRVLGIQIKPPQTHLHYTWIVAVWTPVFTGFLHDFVKTSLKGEKPCQSKEMVSTDREIFMSEVILAAMQNQILVRYIAFPEGNCLDIGSPEDLMLAMQAAGRKPFDF